MKIMKCVSVSRGQPCLVTTLEKRTIVSRVGGVHPDLSGLMAEKLADDSDVPKSACLMDLLRHEVKALTSGTENRKSRSCATS